MTSQEIINGVSLILALIIGAIALVASTRKGFTTGRLQFLILSLGAIFVIYLSINFDKIPPADWAQIMLTGGLVTITGLYTIATQKQAEASIKMAEEMREQRYDTVRPVIDIVTMGLSSLELAKLAYAAKEGKLPKDLPCKLRNVGVGPAIEVYSFIEDAKGETCRWDFGSIPVAIGEEEMGHTLEMPLSLQQRGEHKALVAYYKDVYGRWFESSREVRIGAVDPDSLQIREITEEELPK